MRCETYKLTRHKGSNSADEATRADLPPVSVEATAGDSSSSYRYRSRRVDDQTTTPSSERSTGRNWVRFPQNKVKEQEMAGLSDRWERKDSDTEGEEEMDYCRTLLPPLSSTNHPPRSQKQSRVFPRRKTRCSTQFH